LSHLQKRTGDGVRSGPKVFIIDDDVSIRESIHGLLMSVGLRSECFETAEEFLQSETSDGPSCLYWMLVFLG